MKSKIMAGVLMFIIISVLLTGCGGKQKEIPYPDGYYVPKPEETETAGKSDKSQKNASETAKETTRETIQARAGGETENKKISFYLDTSGSIWDFRKNTDNIYLRDFALMQHCSTGFVHS